MKTRIKQLRKEHRLTQAEFGNRIGVSDASCSIIESGRNNPSGQTIKAICQEFCINEEWLRTGKGPKEAEPKEDQTPQTAKARVQEILCAMLEQLEVEARNTNGDFVAQCEISHAMCAISAELRTLWEPRRGED